jgi:tRNA(fMet)-specific endonuclease VapC
MGVLIDSSIWIQAERTLSALPTLLAGRNEEEAFISVVTASELLHGIHRAKNAAIRAHRLAFVEAILSALPILRIDLATARIHAELWAGLAQRGKMIGVHDSWLAATCLAHGLHLVTGNSREFKRVPGLEIEQWI